MYLVEDLLRDSEICVVKKNTFAITFLSFLELYRGSHSRDVLDMWHVASLRHLVGQHVAIVVVACHSKAATRPLRQRTNHRTGKEQGVKWCKRLKNLKNIATLPSTSYETSELAMQWTPPNSAVQRMICIVAASSGYATQEATVR